MLDRIKYVITFKNMRQTKTSDETHLLYGPGKFRPSCLQIPMFNFCKVGQDCRTLFIEQKFYCFEKSIHHQCRAHSNWWIWREPCLFICH